MATRVAHSPSLHRQIPNDHHGDAPRAAHQNHALQVLWVVFQEGEAGKTSAGARDPVLNQGQGHGPDLQQQLRDPVVVPGERRYIIRMRPTAMGRFVPPTDAAEIPACAGSGKAAPHAIRIHNVSSLSTHDRPPSSPPPSSSSLSKTKVSPSMILDPSAAGRSPSRALNSPPEVAPRREGGAAALLCLRTARSAKIRGPGRLGALFPSWRCRARRPRSRKGRP